MPTDKRPVAITATWVLKIAKVEKTQSEANCRDPGSCSGNSDRVLFGHGSESEGKMAKRTNEQPPQRPSSSLRVRWVEVELNGSDTSIEEALRTVERMRRPAIEAPPIPKRIASTLTPADGDNAPTEDPTQSHSEGQAQVEVATVESPLGSNGDSNAEADTLRKKRGDGERKDRNAGIKPVGDINFVPNGKQSLRDFFAEKAPGSDIDQILVICYFLQHTLQSGQIGPGHILSGFKHVAKPVPKDLKQTIRNMRDKKAWINFTDIESIGLTTEGDNRVEHVLGKGDGGARAN